MRFFSSLFAVIFLQKKTNRNRRKSGLIFFRRLLTVSLKKIFWMDLYGQEWTKWTVFINSISEVHAVHTVRQCSCKSRCFFC